MTGYSVIRSFKSESGYVMFDVRPTGDVNRVEPDATFVGSAYCGGHLWSLHRYSAARYGLRRDGSKTVWLYFNGAGRGGWQFGGAGEIYRGTPQEVFVQTIPTLEMNAQN